MQLKNSVKKQTKRVSHSSGPSRSKGRQHRLFWQQLYHGIRWRYPHFEQQDPGLMHSRSLSRSNIEIYFAIRFVHFQH